MTRLAPTTYERLVRGHQNMSNVFVSVEDIVAAYLEFDAKKRWNTPDITQEDDDASDDSDVETNL